MSGGHAWCLTWCLTRQPESGVEDWAWKRRGQNRFSSVEGLQIRPLESFGGRGAGHAVDHVIVLGSRHTALVQYSPRQATKSTSVPPRQELAILQPMTARMPQILRSRARVSGEHTAYRMTPTVSQRWCWRSVGEIRARRSSNGIFRLDLVTAAPTLPSSDEMRAYCRHTPYMVLRTYI